MGIYRRGKTYWIRLVRDGQEIRRSARTAVKSVALAYERELNAELARVSLGGRPRRSYREAMVRFIEEYLPTLADGAALRYRSSAKQLHGHFEALYLDQIDLSCCKAYVAARRKAGCVIERKDGSKIRRDITPATVKRDLACLGSMFSRCVEWDWIEANPIPVAKSLGLRESKSRTRYLTPGEYAELLAQSSERLRPLVVALVATGLRKEEMLSLTWRQVNLARLELTIKGKGDKTRVVPLSDEAAAVIAAQPRHALSPWVWHIEGERLTDIRQGFAGACRRANIEGFTVHDLRHTFASWAVQGAHPWQSEPMDLYRLSRWLGHSTTRMTERYSHLETADLHRAIVRPKPAAPEISAPPETHESEGEFFRDAAE